MKIASRTTPEGLAGHGMSTTGLTDVSTCELVLPYIRNFPDMCGISVLKFVSVNNFKKYSDVRDFKSFRGSND